MFVCFTFVSSIINLKKTYVMFYYPRPSAVKIYYSGVVNCDCRISRINSWIKHVFCQGVLKRKEDNLKVVWTKFSISSLAVFVTSVTAWQRQEPLHLILEVMRCPQGLSNLGFYILTKNKVLVSFYPFNSLI
jgi:hypothetical protein